MKLINLFYEGREISFDSHSRETEQHENASNDKFRKNSHK